MLSTASTTQTTPRSSPSKQIEILAYGSLIELSVLLGQLDYHSRSNGLRVLIVLDACFGGHLASLAKRKCPAFRLVITTSAERLAGIEEAYREEGISWQQIAIERGIERTIRREIHHTRLNERLIIFWPNWTTP